MQLDLLQKEISAAKAAAAKRAEAVSSPESLLIDAEEKAPRAFKTISEAAKSLGVPQHVLRFWEGRFSQIKPLKLRGGRRYYRPEDMEILSTIKHLLYKQGYTIKGAKKAFGGRSREAEPPAPEKSKPALGEKQQSQLSVIRQELMGLRDILKPHVF